MTTDSTPLERPEGSAARPVEVEFDAAAAIERDLSTLAHLPGQDRIRAIYGLREVPRSPIAA